MDTASKKEDTSFDPHSLLPESHPQHPSNTLTSEAPLERNTPQEEKASTESLKILSFLSFLWPGSNTPPTVNPYEVKNQKTGNTKKLFTGILAIVCFLLVSGVVYLGVSGGAFTQTARLLSPSSGIELVSASSVEPVEKWETYVSQEQGFSMKHPSDVTVTVAHFDSKAVTVFTLIGPTQKENADLTDGISLQFTVGSMGNMTLQDHVTSAANELERQARITKKLQETRVNGVNGYSFTASNVGEVTYIYVPDGGGYLQIADLTQDPENKGYAKIVSEMLKTFRFTAEGESVSSETQ